MVGWLVGWLVEHLFAAEGIPVRSMTGMVALGSGAFLDVWMLSWVGNPSQSTGTEIGSREGDLT